MIVFYLHGVYSFYRVLSLFLEVITQGHSSDSAPYVLFTTLFDGQSTVIGRSGLLRKHWKSAS